ncbi:amino acid adenylation domain-containing protein [Roseivirga sp. BDSF3-8]|uniref:non-ribosomal peptide synthetase n=1 Tax=Roseivirga sp. BDSF3-8 TaxID=3241598 RepID=UPI0035319BF1
MKELLNRITQAGIIVEVKEGNLQMFATTDEVDADLIGEIKGRKDEILSYLLQSQHMAVEEKQYEPISLAESAESYPLSRAQLRLWLASQTEEGSAAYNIPNSVTLNEGIELDSFKEAVLDTVERHEILRTVFKMNKDGEVRQYVRSLEETGLLVGFKDYRNKANPKEAADAYIAADSFAPFDLEKGPLIRAELLQYAEKGYIFYYNLHHIIADGRSMDVLANDVVALYAAIKSSQSSKLEPLEFQYKDFAVWQNQKLDGDQLEKHKSYWQERLQGDIPVIEFPFAKKRPQIKTYNGRGLGFVLNPEVVTALKDYTSQKGGSLMMSLMAAWKVLFRNYTGESDILVGSMLTGRDHVELENQIGFYINVLPVRSHVDTSTSFDDFYNSFKNELIKSYEYQEYPFDQIITDVGAKGSQSRGPLIDIFFNYYEAPDLGNRFDSRNYKDLGDRLVRSDMEFHITTDGNNVNIIINYNQDIYESASIENMAIHYNAIVGALLSDSNQVMGEVDFISGAEKYELLNSYNSHTAPIPSGSTLIGLFEEQTSKTPDQIALIGGEVSLSYGELNEKANRLAAYMSSESGVQKGDFVGVHLNRNTNCIVSILAIMKLGAVYLPVDHTYPADRKKLIIEDAGVQLLLHENSTEELKDFYYGKVLDPREAEGYTADKVFNAPVEGDLAYVIYTSGSTGKPKGVLIQHKAIVNTIISQIDIFKMSAESRVLQFASFSFDASVSEIFTALGSGARLYIAGDDVRNDANRFKDYVIQHDIDTVTLPPSYFQTIDSAAFAKFNMLVTAGEAPEYAKVAEYLTVGKYYCNAYGPTETSICGSAFTVSSAGELPSQNIPIGKPIHNAEIYILNEYNKLVPKGAIGEICIGGPGLAKGYHNRPELTDEKFMSHPFKAGERLYKTGDLGRWLDSGDVEFKGRIDQQVKIRGYRIEPGEVEYAIGRINGVEQASVIALEDCEGFKNLVAYIVAADKALKPVHIKDTLKMALPAYMVPGAYVFIDQIPLTHNGKIDRNKLPLPDDSAFTKQEYVAPGTEVEKHLANAWKQILGPEKVGVNDNFFDLGGHSLLAAKLAFAVSRSLKMEFSMNNLFKYPTIRSLGQYIELLISQKDDTSASEVDDEEVMFL